MAHSRIDDLRRRVEADPASIAFAQLAEEYRRAGDTEEAVRVSREGLTRHPGYLSARVTLGRALLELNQLDEARTELEFVAAEAPENLAAVRGLAEICHREGDAAAALEYFQRALSLARHDPELEEIVQQLSRQVGADAGPSNGLTFEEAHQELLSAAERVPLVAAGAAEAPVAAEPGSPTAPFNFDTLVAALGTPAAPPLVEAVVSGDTPPVFQLPELPAAGGDPFAALEAELRAQDDPTAPTIEDQVAAIIATEEAPVADGLDTPVEAVPEEAVSVQTEAPAAEAPAEPPADAVSWPELTTPEWALPAEPASAAPEPLVPWLSERTADAVSGESQADQRPYDEAPPTTIAATAPAEDAPAEEVPMATSDLPELPDLTGLIATEVDEVEAPVEVAPVAAVAAEPAAELDAAPPPPALSADDEAETDSSSPARGDDVLGDIEDWLHTLQDRSAQ